MLTVLIITAMYLAVGCAAVWYVGDGIWLTWPERVTIAVAWLPGIVWAFLSDVV